MFIKRFLNSKREKKALITQIVLPLLLVLVGLLLSMSGKSQDDDPKRLLNLNMLNVESESLSAFFADTSANENSSLASVRHLCFCILSLLYCILFIFTQYSTLDGK